MIIKWRSGVDIWKNLKCERTKLKGSKDTSFDSAPVDSSTGKQVGSGSNWTPHDLIGLYLCVQLAHREA